jgi:hypothetical protein
VVRTEGEELQAVLPGLERPRRRWRYTYGVQRADVEQLAVELDPAAAAENDVDLLGVDCADFQVGPERRRGRNLAPRRLTH